MDIRLFDGSIKTSDAELGYVLDRISGVIDRIADAAGHVDRGAQGAPAGQVGSGRRHRERTVVEGGLAAEAGGVIIAPPGGGEKVLLRA
jgi:hypothetical protein